MMDAIGSVLHSDQSSCRSADTTTGTMMALDTITQSPQHEWGIEIGYDLVST